MNRDAACEHGCKPDAIVFGCPVHDYLTTDAADPTEPAAAKVRRKDIWKRTQSDHSVTLYSEEGDKGTRYILKVWKSKDDSTTSTETEWVPYA